MKRVTLACPEALISDANALMSCLGNSPEDRRSFDLPTWSDAEGRRYSVSSQLVAQDWLDAAAAPLASPAWEADLAAAARAQARLDWISGPGPIDPERIVVLVGEDPLLLLQRCGLSAAEVLPLA